MTAAGDAFEQESRLRRGIAIDAFGALVARYPRARCIFSPDGSVFRPPVEVLVDGGDRFATVAAHAGGVTVVLEGDQALHTYDEMPFGRSLEHGLHTLRVALDEFTGDADGERPDRRERTGVRRRVD